MPYQVAGGWLLMIVTAAAGGWFGGRRGGRRMMRMRRGGRTANMNVVIAFEERGVGRTAVPPAGLGEGFGTKVLAHEDGFDGEG